VLLLQAYCLTQQLQTKQDRLCPVTKQARRIFSGSALHGHPLSPVCRRHQHSQMLLAPSQWASCAHSTLPAIPTAGPTD